MKVPTPLQLEMIASMLRCVERHEREYEAEHINDDALRVVFGNREGVRTHRDRKSAPPTGQRVKRTTHGLPANVRKTEIGDNHV